MATYIIRRLLWTPFVLLIVSFITFALGHFGPGDPVQVLMGQKNDPVVVERIRKERGLDEPFLQQYVSYIIGTPKNTLEDRPFVVRAFNYILGERHPKRRGIVRGDFGESYRYSGRRVNELLFNRVLVSAQLGTLAMAIGVGLGMVFGLIAAANQGRSIDPWTVTGALFLSSLPIFIVQPLLAFFLARQLHLLPSAGWEGLFHPKIIMPALILSLGPIGGITRLMRASTLEVINQDYVRTARAKGLSEGTVRLHHITRNSVLPVFTVVGLSLATLVEGGFIAETLFGIPGVGRLALESFFARDFPVIMAITLLVAAGYVLANLMVDIGYTFLDPRIRLQ